MTCLIFFALNLVLPCLLYLAFKTKVGKKLRKTLLHPIIKKAHAAVNLQELSDERQKYLKDTPEAEQEQPKNLSTPQETDTHLIYGLDDEGNSLIVKMVLRNSLHAEIMIEVRVKNGKVYKLPNENGVIVCSIQSRQWKAQGLYLQVLEPYKRLRITYNGMLRNTSLEKTNGNGLEHVQLNFIWNAGSAPFHYPQDFHKKLLIEAIANRSWKEGDWLKYMSSENGYDQFGCLTGFIKGSEYADEVTLRLPSYRRRRWGYSEVVSTTKEVSNFGVCKNGTLFNVSVRFLKGTDGVNPLKFGFMRLSNGETRPIQKFSLGFEDVDVEHLPHSGVLSITCNKKKFSGTMPLKGKLLTQSRNDDEVGWKVAHIVSKGSFDQSETDVITTIWSQHQGVTKEVLPKSLLMQKSATNAGNVLVCRLNSPECLDLSITGGKGNSLGLLTSIKSDIFTVPGGFVITVNAFKRQLLANRELTETIERLENVCYGKIDGNIEETCNSASEIFSKKSVCDDLAKIIMEEVDEINSQLSGEEKEWRWAVRSSGVGEDSDELSAAGQNSTFLGCHNEDILKAVASCWGSIYTFQSVQYRKQHGMPINCGMAVVVQKTVPAECAGVLFTCHPATGNPSHMVITSNFGLGESVVSATADPDTITLRRSYEDDTITVTEYNIGAKKVQITLEDNVKGGLGGTQEKEIDEALAGKLSVTEEQAVNLGRLGVLLEEEFGNPRDIEWAYYKGKLYLLQSRPITTLNTWTDFELLHEFDTPVYSGEDVFSRVNIGEVMKGAITPLTHSTSLSQIDQFMQKDLLGTINPYVLTGCPTVLHYGFVNVLNVLYKMVPHEINVEVRVTELAMLGHPFMDEKIHKEVLRRHGLNTGLKKILTRAQLFYKAFFRKDRLKTAIDINNNWDISIGAEDSSEKIFDKITNSFHMFKRILGCYINVGFTNTIYDMVCVSIITGGEHEFGPDHYHDFAMVLKTSDGVETLELPIILEEIAGYIRKSGKVEDFIKRKPEECIKWMTENCAEAEKAFDNFLKVHGHRLFSEYEFASKPWIEDPSEILTMIQANCRVESATKMARGLEVDETVDKLLTPLTNFKRRILKFFVRKLRESIITKEQTKSQLIRCLGKFRTAYKKLSERMVAEGYIPQQDLIYHLTQTELGEVIKERDPVIISKAIRRKRLFPIWNRMQFSDMCIGFPVPDRDGTEDFVVERKAGEEVKLKGTPVYPGKVICKARVIIDLKDCVQLESGDILITYSTDVGWTPYFPMLSGVVTEIGGLLSHGAVVAREYGLPCIVGVQGVTKAFKTGDTVLLNGKNGELELVSN